MSHNAARKLKRALVQRALDSKVVVGAIPEAPKDATPAPTKKLRLPMSEEQFALLLNAQAKASAATGEVQMILQTCLAQHHVLRGNIVEVVPGRPAKIVVEVPDEDRKGRKK